MSSLFQSTVQLSKHPLVTPLRKLSSKTHDAVLGSPSPCRSTPVQIDLPAPSLLKPQELWTGKQLWSVLVRPNARTR
jgi:hypothetical protein